MGQQRPKLTFHRMPDQAFIPGFPSLADHLLLLVFGWLLPFLSGVKGAEQMKGMVFSERSRRRFFLGNSASLCLAAGIVCAVWLLQGRSMETLGLRDADPDSTAKAVPIILLLVGLWLGDMLLSQKISRKLDSENESGLEYPTFLPEHFRELPAYVLLCLSAAIFEEMIYRGFMVTYFLPGTRGADGLPLAATFIPALLFSLAHYYQGWLATLKIFVLAILMGLLFMVTRSLWILMGIHFLIDLAGGLYAMRLRRKEH